jgi:hypothetical protein
VIRTNDRWLKSRHTKPEILANFEDLKVLGKGDFKALMKWRLAIRLEIGLDVKADPAAEATEDVTVEPMDEEEQISEEVRILTTPYYALLTPAQTPARRQIDPTEARQEAVQREETARPAQTSTQHDCTC